MSARGFKSVGWVAAVGGAALSCYMLSLRVATERNELARVESQIIAAKQDIRSLQTELGTRGRLSQLERWNADVLALSAPISGQFLQDEFTLARFDQRERSFEERAEVRMASADTAAPAPAVKAASPTVEAEAPSEPAASVRLASAASPQAAGAPAVLRAAYAPPSPKPQGGHRRTALIDSKLATEIAAVSRAEKVEKPAKSPKADSRGTQ